LDGKVTWKQGMSFDGWGGNSGFSLPMGTSIESGGSNDGFRPMELILIGLAGCTGMDVISILQKKKQNVTAFDIRVHGERAAEHPKVFTDIMVEFVVTGHDLDPAAVERAVELSTVKYCSANAMLSVAVKIDHKITILEG
jgi:putative redox protein